MLQVLYAEGLESCEECDSSIESRWIIKGVAELAYIVHVTSLLFQRQYIHKQAESEDPFRMTMICALREWVEICQEVGDAV